jgi:hypothetical protein
LFIGTIRLIHAHSPAALSLPPRFFAPSDKNGILSESKFYEELDTPLGLTVATVYSNWELVKEMSFMTNDNSVVLRSFCSKVTAGPFEYEVAHKCHNLTEIVTPKKKCFKPEIVTLGPGELEKSADHEHERAGIHRRQTPHRQECRGSQDLLRVREDLSGHQLTFSKVRTLLEKKKKRSPEVKNKVVNCCLF